MGGSHYFQRLLATTIECSYFSLLSLKRLRSHTLLISCCADAPFQAGHVHRAIRVRSRPQAVTMSPSQQIQVEYYTIARFTSSGLEATICPKGPVRSCTPGPASSNTTSWIGLTTVSATLAQYLVLIPRIDYVLVCLRINCFPKENTRLLQY
jgi:hypothetical protein